MAVNENQCDFISLGKTLYENQYTSASFSHFGFTVRTSDQREVKYIKLLDNAAQITHIHGGNILLFLSNRQPSH